MLSPAKLVGRGAEIAALDRAYRRAASGALCVALLIAGPGVGKTRLAREFLGRRRQETIALSARGYPLGSTVSFGVWAEAFEHHLRGLHKEDIGRLCGGFLDDLATVLRSVAVVRNPDITYTPSRPRLLGGFGILLSNLAKRAPVIVLIDDAHDADPSSWETLGYLARDLSDARVLVLLAARPFELGENPVATEVTQRLEQDGLLERLTLQPLETTVLGSLAEAALGDTPPPALVNWLAVRSRGNPLFALGLLQALLDDDADLTAPELQSIPEELAERVGAQLKNLDSPAIGVLESLAAIGRRTDLRDLTGLAGLSADRLADVLERLVRSRLVVEDSRGQDLSYEVAHPLVQDAIYQRITTVRRRGTHRTIARALLAAGRLGEAAPHFVRSAAVGDDEAISALRDAVHQAEARDAFREALTILDALFELLPVDDPRWLNVFQVLSGRAEWVVDHRADTHALLGIKAMKAIDLALQKSSDPAPRAMVKLRLANFLGWGPGDLDGAERACLEAQALFDQAGDKASAVLARNELSWLKGLRGDYRAMEAASESLRTDADATGDPFARIQVLHSQAFAAGLRGRFRSGNAPNRLGNDIAQEAGKSYRLTIGLVYAGLVLAAQGRTGEAVTVLAEGKALNPGWRDSLLPEWESIVHWFAGDFRAAVGCAREAATRASGDLSKRRGIGVLFAALSAVETAEAEQARSFLARARAAYGSVDWQFFSHYCDYVQGLLDWQGGRVSNAVALLRQTAARVQATGALPFAALVLVDLAEIAAERGDANLAGDALGRLESVAGQIECDLYGALAAIGRACCDQAIGRGDRGAQAGREALDRLAASDWKAFRARAMERLGRSLVGRDASGAAETLRRAANLFDACGAVWRRDRALAVLRSMGPRGRRAATAGLGATALSRRERQVARLAAQGLMATAIAEQLSISERTVETHLVNIYTKLGVSSKTDLIRKASEFGLD